MTTQTTTEAVSTTYEVPAESRKLAMLAHLSAFVSFVGIPSLVGPLVVWLLNRDDPFVEQQAKDALNFNISFLIYGIAAAISIILLVGLILSVCAARTVARTEDCGQGKFDRPFFVAALVTLLILSGFYGSTVMEWLFVR